MTTHTISVLAGDGIGLEVMPVAIEVLDAATRDHDVELVWQTQDWGSDYHFAHGRMMPSDAIETMAATDAIFLGAVGHPDVSDVETLWGMLIPIRRAFDQYVNLRPVRSFSGVRSSLAGDPEIDVVIVRENVEGEYSEVGGRSYPGTPYEAAYQQSLFTRHGIERITRYAVEVASARRKHLVSATKSNGIIHTMPFWDEVVAEVVGRAGDIELESVLIDALAARAVRSPQSLDVIVASNLFGDILSDLVAGAVGSIGIAPSANLNPEGAHPSMFEPVHGSAPDIAGRGIANPVGQIWAGAMMLRHLGHPQIADQVEAAFTAVVERGEVTPDLGGSLTTREVGAAVIAELEAQRGAGSGA
jgi:tartrate dehydrogenase/decarboxylase/D-malate dehydrogenase